MKRILVNLLSNAIKFTERGRVKVKVWEHGDDIVISVEDTGIGIKKRITSEFLKLFAKQINLSHALILVLAWDWQLLIL